MRMKPTKSGLEQEVIQTCDEDAARTTSIFIEASVTTVLDT